MILPTLSHREDENYYPPSTHTQEKTETSLVDQVQPDEGKWKALKRNLKRVISGTDLWGALLSLSLSVISKE